MRSLKEIAVLNSCSYVTLWRRIKRLKEKGIWTKKTKELLTDQELELLKKNLGLKI